MTKSNFPDTFPKLETTRLILREITQEDDIDIFKNFSDPEIAIWFFTEPFNELE
jgi:hypothetical protein